MKLSLLGGNPYGGGNPFGEGIDPEDILKNFFRGGDNPFGFGTRSGGYGSDFQEIQQVRHSKTKQFCLFFTPLPDSFYKIKHHIFILVRYSVITYWKLAAVKCHPDTIVKVTKQLINPLTPMTDQDRISPYNINTISTRYEMRMKKNTNLGIIRWSNTKFSELAL